LAQDVERFAGGFYSLGRCAHRTTHARNPIPECAGSDGKLCATISEPIQRSYCFGHHGRRTQWKVCHIRHEMDLVRLCGEESDQRPSVDERMVVCVILNGNQVQSSSIVTWTRSKIPSRSAASGVTNSPNCSGAP
jgi:hypothetical protein